MTRGPASRVLVDVGRSNRSGSWSAFGDFTDAGGALVKVVKKNIGPKGHKHICKGASFGDF
jgi:hypothetical protein